MSYRAVKCWYCGQVPHPLDVNHTAWCSRNFAARQASAPTGDSAGRAETGME